MITQLSSPSVCVIEDEEEDYEPILAALNGLFVSCVHLLGTMDNLPPQPFKRVQLVFVDLHLSGTVGKAAASHTANVFTKVVSPDTAPIVVVIWSKYAKDIADNSLPPDDQETEAALFKRMLLEAVPGFKERLIFVELDKPKVDERSQDWTEKLKHEIDKALKNQSAVDLLWAYDSLVKDACAAVSAGLTSVAAAQADVELKDSLKSMMQRLTKAQGENDLSAGTAPGHFVTVLTQLLSDQIEHTDSATLAPHGTWLAAKPSIAATAEFAGRMNATLLTANVIGDTPFQPGTVYKLRQLDTFRSAFGLDGATLVEELCGEKAESEKRVQWRAAVCPVVVEVSPACDVAQNNRVSSFLVAGLIVPADRKKQIKKAESFVQLPAFRLRWPRNDFPEQDAILVFCHRYKAALPAATLPAWLEPWFRLRELPTASVRNAQAGHGARVGYVSL